MPKKLLFPLFAIVFFLVLAFLWPKKQKEPENVISNFEQCAAAGNQVFETYPEQCKMPDGTVFVKQNIQEK